MLCAKCQQNEATCHFTMIVDGRQDETVHFCKERALPTGLEGVDLEQLKALAVTRKECAFCGEEAFSGVMDSAEPIYYCFQLTISS